MEQGTTPASPQVLRIIWMALLASTAAYFVILNLLEARPPTDALGTIQPILLALAVASAIAVLVLHRRIGDGPFPTDPAAAQQTFTMHIICWALSESVALYGFVLGMLGAGAPDVFPYFIGAAILLWVTRPRG